jgi:hypothetical protein
VNLVGCRHHVVKITEQVAVELDAVAMADMPSSTGDDGSRGNSRHGGL